MVASVAFYNVMLVQMWWREAGVVVFRTVMLIQMWGRDRFEVAVTVRQARVGRFPQCNAGADVVHGGKQRWLLFAL